MKTTKQFFSICIIALLFVQTSFAQKSIKQSKQSTDFFYTQLNLNGGWLLADTPEWMFSEVSPYSNINFTLRSKNQGLLQKGYVRTIAVSDYKANFAVVYKNIANENGTTNPQLSLQMRDLWLKIKTKWDRTSLKVGHFKLPYGHAPKMDLDNSFIAALGGQDLGFNRDMGILFKTPVNPNFDAEIALTMGGSVPTTMMTYDFVSDGENGVDNFTKATFDYQNNWLATARIGNPTFYKSEIGFFAAIGKVNGTAFTDEQSNIYRFGADWTYKHKEQFRITNQAVTGYTVTESGNHGFNVNQKTEFDYFLKSRVVLSVSNSLQFQEYTPTETFQGTAVASISYALNPHTRLKVNAYSKYNMKEKSQEPGVFLQFVTGFGRRN